MRIFSNKYFPLLQTAGQFSAAADSGSVLIYLIIEKILIIILMIEDSIEYRTI